MSEDQEFRTISFDDQEAIHTAIKNHETFEVVGCQGRMDEAVEFVESIIGRESMTSKVYTKGRLFAASALGVATLPFGAAAAAAQAVHSLVTQAPDYEVMKRPVDKVLRLTYVKDDPTLTDDISEKYSQMKDELSSTTETISLVSSDAAKRAGSAISDTSMQAVSAASNAVDEYTPDVVKATSEKVSNSVDVLTGAKLLESVQEMIGLQEKYNDVLAGKLDDALTRIEQLEEVIKIEGAQHGN